MRKFSREFFYVSQHGKVREKVLLTRLVTTITIVIMCLAAMSITAYAYFSYNITSGSNIIRSATFKTEVQVQITDEAGNAVETAKPITSDYRLYNIPDLKIGEWYTVTIKPKQTETSAKTGFVIVTATGCNETYHTQQLGVDESVPNGETPEIKFQLMITKNTDVVFDAHWGTSSYYPKFKDTDDDHYITYKDGQMKKIKMIVDGIDEPPIQSQTENNIPSTESASSPATQTNSSATENTTPSTTVTTPPASTETGESTNTTEPATAETTASSEHTVSVDITKPITTTGTQSATTTTEVTETTGATSTEATTE